MEIKKTQRGFDYTEFKDRYGAKCSLQKSSSALKDCIWLGVDDADPQIMNSDAVRLGLPSDGVTGWTSFNIPSEVSLTTRMHLTQEMVAELLPVLQKFAETGDLE